MLFFVIPLLENVIQQIKGVEKGLINLHYVVSFCNFVVLELQSINMLFMAQESGQWPLPL